MGSEMCIRDSLVATGFSVGVSYNMVFRGVSRLIIEYYIGNIQDNGV